MARKAPVHVGGEDRRGEAVADAVGDADRLVEVVDGDKRRRRAEDLFLGDPHVPLDVGEDRRPVEEAGVEAVVAGDLAAGEQRRALVLPDLGVRVDLLERGALMTGPTSVRPPARPRRRLDRATSRDRTSS